jgi:hypothetical protein
MSIMKSLRALVAATGLALMFALPVVAQDAAPAAPAAQEIDPVRLAAARDLLTASKVEEHLTKTLPAMFQQMTGPMVDHFAGSVPDEAARERFRKAMTAIMEVMQREFVARRGDIMDIAAKVYARTFTVEEMNAVATFLRSPVGTRFVDATPELQRKVVELFTNLATGKPLPKPAETDAAKLAAARQMFTASKLDATLDAMFAALSETRADRGNALLDNLKSRRGEIVDVLASTYAETFTVEEMNEVTAFYNSPHGAKLVQAMPAMMQETANATHEVAQRFAADIGKKITEELRKTQP